MNGAPGEAMVGGLYPVVSESQMTHPGKGGRDGAPFVGYSEMERGVGRPAHPFEVDATVSELGY